MRRWVIVAVGLGLVLAGCGNGNSGSSTPSSPEPTVSSAPAQLTKAQAAALYLQIVKPFNDQNRTLSAALQTYNADVSEKTLVPARREVARLATSQRAFTDGLVAAHWPTDVQPAVDTFVAALAKAQVLLNGMAAATTTEEFGRLGTSWAEDDATTTAAQLVRQRLGLPDVGRL